jgi:ABC-type multidrug transport system fused ATPase/permease subunit
VIAYTYPLLSIFWTMLEFFLFFLWIWLIITVLADIFRSHDLSGVAKALWVILLVIVPFLGVFLYVLVRGGSMHERAVVRMQHQQRAFDSYVQHAAGAGSTADQLVKLADLRDRGAISDEEFASEKAKILG